MIGILATMGLVMGALIALVVLLNWARGRFNLHPEVARKLLHVGVGLIALSFPWMFAPRWPVVVMATAGIIGLLGLRLSHRTRRGPGNLITGVDRHSLGEIYFPLAIAILVCLYHNPLMFVIPMLIITFADAVAALIGITYGKFHYEAEEGEKSFEGSIAFFTVAFLAVLVPLLLFGHLGRGVTLLIAAMLGLVIMLMEAISWRGLDNLFIPIGSYAILQQYIPLGIHDLLVRMAVTIGLVAFVCTFRKRSTLTFTALLGAALFGYAAFALGGLIWMVPPLALFLCHSFLWPKSASNDTRHDIHALVSTSGPGLVWLLLRVLFHNSAMILPFTALFSAHLAIIGVSWLYPRPQSRGIIMHAIISILAGVLLAPFTFACAWLLTRTALTTNSTSPLLARPFAFDAMNLIATASAAILFAMILPSLMNRSRKQFVRVHQLGGILAAMASTTIFLTFVR